MKIKEILFIQFIITLFLAPIQLSLNQELTPWGLLLNPIAIPYSVFVLLPLSLAAFIVFPFSVDTSEMFLLLASKGSGILLNVIDSKYSILISLIFLLFFIKYGIRLLSSPKLMGLLKIFLTTQIAFFPLSTGLENSRKISFLNVGQGDSMIYETSNCNLFIDTGKFKDFKRDLISKAKEQELIIITHPHADHYGGLSKLINKARTPVIYLPRSSLKHSELKKMLSYSQRESKGPLKIIFINSGHSKAKACGLDIDFYTPEGYSKDPNDSSPLIKFTLSSNFKVASLGDLSSKEFENLLWTHRKKFCEKVDLLKISHHGSKYSTSESHFTCFKPKTSIVSSSKNNTYGHPHPEVLNLIRKYKSKALLTSEIGNFTWLMNEPGIWNYQNSKD